MTLKSSRYYMLISLFFSLWLAACQGLGGEPRIIATLPPPTPTPEVIDATATPDAVIMAGIETQSAPIDMSAPPAEASATDGRVVGDVVNASTGERPAGLDVTLVIVDTAERRTTRETTSGDDGAFTFDDVPFVGGYVYFAVVEYDGVPYVSETASAAPAMSQIDLSLMVFDTTDDAAIIEIESWISQIDAVGGFLEYADTITVVNSGTETFLTGRRFGADSRRVSLTFELPPGAIFVGAPSDRNAIFDDATRNVFLTTPIYPGQTVQINLQYIIPYRGDGAVIAFTPRYQLNGAMALLLRRESLNAQADWILTDEPRIVNGQNVRLLGGPLTAAPDDLITYEIRGAALAVGSSQRGDTITSDVLLPVVLIAITVLALVLLGVTAAFRRGDSGGASQNRMIDSILRQIDQIEAAHDSGAMNHDVYQRRKAELRERLAQIRGDHPADKSDV
ncbi:MAG: hypothetical protein EA396_11755 [Anaerolineaceae bacterium]|nr:MAG: hypothetical protein EA396_11755 [Anaerolineaceae bacterium]